MGLKPYLLFACLCVSSGVLAKNESVKISVGQEGNYRVVNVTGLANELTINKVVVNRGQCRASLSNPIKPYTLKFGATQSYRYMLYNSVNGSRYHCDVVEIVVETAQGTWTFTPTS
ncbi:hypothetical protein RDV79_05310 [Aeromonas dhakensis]|uniref:hypothetical protein n=1 Tax=Aeromonas dhakensis TaxID=196024 RepID=UPI002A7FC484|nr:hypothetical protein [Aeromonas dhakensis]WPS58052.1 hypothetical protein RDV79_05310 [Aeromonas dhakensis]